MVPKLDIPYPYFSDIEGSFVEVIRTLKLNYNSVKSNIEYNVPISNGQNNRTINSYATGSKKVANSIYHKKCKFWSTEGHSMLRCSFYNTLTSRIERCNELNTCSRCSSARLNSNCCPGKLDFPCSVCSAKTHISALCPFFNNTSNKTCTNVNLSKSCNYLMPTLTIKVFYGKLHTYIRCLNDSGSQRSYLSTAALNRVYFPTNERKSDFQVNTFLNTKNCNFAESSVSFSVGNSQTKFQMPFLLDSIFNLQFDIKSLPKIISDLIQRYTIADSSFHKVKSSSIFSVNLNCSNLIMDQCLTLILVLFHLVTPIISSL